MTVTPIFGDNMSPAGFGSVPCEKLDIMLDGERLQLMDWQGGGRAPAANCGGRRQAAVRSGQAGPEAFFGGRGGTPMRVRFKTTAGLHRMGVTFLQTNLAPVLDLDQHFARSTVQTGPTPGYTFFRTSVLCESRARTGQRPPRIRPAGTGYSCAARPEPRVRRHARER